MGLRIRHGRYRREARLLRVPGLLAGAVPAAMPLPGLRAQPDRALQRSYETCDL